MKHDDTTLQAAIDAAFQTNGEKYGGNLVTDQTYEPFWSREDPARLALAKAFLAKLPEPEPSMALQQLAGEKGNSQAIKEVQKYASTLTVEGINGLLKAIQECLPEPETQPIFAAASGEVIGINGLTEAEEAKTASVAGLSKPAHSTFEAHGKVWNRHTPGYPMPCDGGRKVFCISNSPDCYDGAMEASRWSWGFETISIIGWRYADEPGSTDWKAKAEKAEAALAESEKQFQAKVTEILETLGRAEKAEAELAALKSSPIGILRPLSEAGPVPDGCVRVTALKNYEDEWAIGDSPSQRDTHFADIRLPVTDTPAPTVNEQPRQQVPLGPEDVMPGSVLRTAEGHWFNPTYATTEGVATTTQLETRFIVWAILMNEGWQINTSLPDTGRWDANAWEPCYKLI